ncbi:MAG: helix-turn-helix domain-containing protein, partial [Firmicutes bacterium]|nr:helix-turn-helix domain-containing protein [Bacillota bacterium]
MFKEKLKKLREDKGLTQQELANQLFVTRSAVAKWEQGRGIPNPDSIDAIADFFAIDQKELFNEQDVIEVLYTIQ